MLQKLQQKWKVNNTNLLLILVTFALGGSLCGFIGKRIMAFLPFEQGAMWVVIYIIILTIIWPFCVLFTSIFLGQFPFFKKYISKILRRVTGGRGAQPDLAEDQTASRIAIFASGAGSNAKQIIEHFKDNPAVRVEVIVCNKPGAGVLQIAKHYGIKTLLIEREQFFNGDGYTTALKQMKVTHIVLAGFLWKIPHTVLKQWPQAIVNIHPALLPKYGGKGMYGARVHEAVIANEEKESGITIHYVDEVYDNGDIIYQARCDVENMDTPETLARKIHQLEHKYYPAAIEEFLKAKTTLNKTPIS